MSICIPCPQGHSVLINTTRLGGEILCPCCMTSFLAELPLSCDHNARPEKGKAKRSRDDEDDEDDEDEKPQKKIKAKRRDDEDEDEDEDEKPQKKAKQKSARKPRDEEEEDEDEDDEEDEDEPEEEEEEPIQWTPRKKQLNLCGNALVGLTVVCYMLHGFLFFTILAIAIYQIVPEYHAEAWLVFKFAAVPLLYLATATLIGNALISLAVPAKAEARTPLLSALVFAGLVFFLGILIILTLLDMMVSDPLRKERLMGLLLTSSVLCFAIGWISMMGYLSKLLIFMKMHMESSQPITGGAFVLMTFLGILALVWGGELAKPSIGSWLSYVVAAGSLGLVVYSGYVLTTLIQLFLKLRKAIITHIKDA
jgi:hypothetical protein